MATKKNKLPKRYIKKYGISKKAWAAYRKGTLSGPAKKKTVKKKTVKRKSTPKKTIIKSVRIGASKMAKRKRKYTKRKRTRSRRLGAPRAMRLIGPKTVNAIVDGFLVGGGAVGSTWAINMVPWVKDQTAWLKAGIQALAGAVGIGLFRDQYVKKLMAGMVAGGAISMIIPLMPESFKFAGGARDFTEDELLELQTMGIPVSISDPDQAEDPETMGIPVSISDPDNQTMGRRCKSRY